MPEHFGFIKYRNSENQEGPACPFGPGNQRKDERL